MLRTILFESTVKLFDRLVQSVGKYLSSWLSDTSIPGVSVAASGRTAEMTWGETEFTQAKGNKAR